MVTVGEGLSWARGVLARSQTASLDAQLLMGHVLGKPRAWVLAHRDPSLPLEARKRFEDLVLRRAQGEPVAYLRGWVEWRDMELEVTPDVLIPRPETELLVEKAIHLAQENSTASVADVGTGSGAIAIALAGALSGIEVFAVDQSEAALRVALRNARKHGVAERVTFLLGDLLDPLSTRPDMVVGNLPYLSSDSMESLVGDVKHEPQQALLAGPTGLDLYSTLFRQLHEKRWVPTLVVEIDPRQKPLIGQLVEEWFSGATLEIFEDYAGLDRIVVIRP